MHEQKEISLIDKVLVFSLLNKKDTISKKTSANRDDIEEYALSIQQVKEIINYEPNITRMPGRPNYIMGILNLRSETIPIMDLGYRLNYEVDYPTSKIVIVYIHNEKVGLIVQSVKDVLTIDASKELEDAPYKDGIHFVTGIIKKHEYSSEEDEDLKQLINTRVITLLDADKIIRPEDAKFELID